MSRVFQKTQIAHCFTDKHNTFRRVFWFGRGTCPQEGKPAWGETSPKPVPGRPCKNKAQSCRRVTQTAAQGPRGPAGTLPARAPGREGNTGVGTAHPARCLPSFYLLHHLCLGAETPSEAKRCCSAAPPTAAGTPVSCPGSVSPTAAPPPWATAAGGPGGCRWAMGAGRHSALHPPGSKTSGRYLQSCLFWFFSSLTSRCILQHLQ